MRANYGIMEKRKHKTNEHEQLQRLIKTNILLDQMIKTQKVLALAYHDKLAIG